MVHRSRQPAFIQHVENLLELHDVHSLEIALRAQRRGKQVLGDAALCSRHVFERQPDPGGRPELPVLALGVLEREDHHLGPIDPEHIGDETSAAADALVNLGGCLEHLVARGLGRSILSRRDGNHCENQNEAAAAILHRDPPPVPRGILRSLPIMRIVATPVKRVSVELSRRDGVLPANERRHLDRGQAAGSLNQAAGITV